jgi:hypothetical protein
LMITIVRNMCCEIVSPCPQLQQKWCHCEEISGACGTIRIERETRRHNPRAEKRALFRGTRATVVGVTVTVNALEKAGQGPGHLRHHLAKFIRSVTCAAQDRRHHLVQQKVVKRRPGAVAFGIPWSIGKPRCAKFDIGRGTIVDHLPPGMIGDRPTLPWTETHQVGVDP